MFSTLRRSLLRLVCSLHPESRRRFSPRDGHQSIQVEFLERRQLLTAGDLDPTFGVGGHVETEYATSIEAAKALASVVQSDGKIIAAGEGGIARFLPDGSLDTTFGVGGQVQYPYFARSIALQTNGSIVVAGGTTSVNSTDFVVSRYRSNGTIDTSFDTDGHVQLNLGGASEYANDVAIQTNGRIVVVGISDSQIAVARLTAAGALDTAFSGDGLLLKTIYSRWNEANAVAIQPDGKIVVAGSTWSYSFSSSIHDLFVMRLNPGGGMDSAFDTDGVATIAGGRQAVGRDMTLLANGQIVVSGWSDAGFKNNVVVGKLNADGSPDTSFDGDGRASAVLSSSSSSLVDRTGGEAHVVMADGSIVVSAGSRLIKFGADGVQDTAAYKTVTMTSIFDMAALTGDRLLLTGSVSTRFGTAMVKADRTLDSAYSGDGLAPVEFGNSDDLASRSVQQSDGRIVVASTSLNTFAVTRYLPTGALDTTFSQDGKVTINFGAQYLNAIASDVAVQADGRIVVVGYVSQIDSTTQNSVESHVAVARLNADGSLDTTFGTNGLVVTRLGGFGRANTVKVETNGRILVGGLGNGGFFTLLRYLSNGTLDNSFSGDGIQTVFNNSTLLSSSLNDLVIQPDGKILTTGELSPYSSNTYSTVLLVARFNTNGTLDTTFGSGGRIMATSMQQRTGQRLALLSDGSFYVGGNEVTYRQFSPLSQMALSRFTSSGQLVFEKVITPFTQNYAPNPTSVGTVNSTLNSILVQPDGRVVMSGSAGNLLGIVRLNADGTEDTSFGGDGRSQFTLPATGRYFGADVFRQSSGRLVMVGSFRPNNSSRSNLLLTRVDATTPAGPSTSVFVASNGQIQIRDNWSRDDSLRLQVVGDYLQVQDLTTDSQASFVVTGVAGVTGAGTKSIMIPLAAIQQSAMPLVLDTGAGDDRLAAITDPLNFKYLKLQFKAGAGFDELSGLSSTYKTTWAVNGQGAGVVFSDFAFGSFTFTDVNSLVGSSSNDQFTLNAISTPEWLILDGGDGGNDEVRIVANADIKLTNSLAEIRGAIQQNIVIQRFESAGLFGGTAANLLDGRDFPGRSYLEGGDGDDILIGGPNQDVLRGGFGNDQLFGKDGDDRLYGETGDDFISGGNGNDEVYGSQGRDILFGGYGADLIVGGKGEDLLVSGEVFGLGESDLDGLKRQLVRSTWSDTLLTYEQRVVAIRDTGVGTSAPLFRLAAGQTVAPDADRDQLEGGEDRDWFFATTVTTGSTDLFLDRKLDEELTLLN